MDDIQERTFICKDTISFIMSEDEDQKAAQIYIDQLSDLVCYQYKIELIRASGIDTGNAKVMGIYTSSFPYYMRYFGGSYVSS